MEKDVQILLLVGLVLIVVGTVGIVALDATDLDLNTGFGLVPDEMFGLPSVWVISGVLLVIMLVLFYFVVWRRSN